MKKNITQILFIVCLAIIGSTFVSCKKEGCTNDKAQNYDEKAKEDDGSCTYDSDKFVGNYAVTDVCDGQTLTYGMTINKNAADPSKLSLLNLGDYFGPAVAVVATVDGNNLSFHDNVLSAVFSGNGTLSGNTLTIDYSINDFGEIESCVAVGEK